MELSWLSHEDFKEKVKEIWIQPVVGQNSVQRWNRKIGALSTPAGMGTPSP